MIAAFTPPDTLPPSFNLGARDVLSDFDLPADDTDVVAVTTTDPAAEPDTAVPLLEPEPTPPTEPPAPEPVAETPLPVIAAPQPQPIPDGPDSILVSRILAERADVLNAYFREHIRHDGRQHEGWVKQIGGNDSAEGYARYWYERNGRFEGYNQGQITAGENIDIGRLLAERPDVLHAYQRDYLDHKGWKSHEWKELLGGNSAEDYAKYWFRNHGQYEGYNQRPPAPAAADVSEPPADPPPAPPAPPEEAPIPQEFPTTEPVAAIPEPQPEEPQEEADPAPMPNPPPAVQPEPDPDPPAQEEVIVLVGAPAEDPILI